MHAHKSTDKLPYITIKSGRFAAISVFETSWKGDIMLNKEVKFCSDAIQAGIFNDLGFGNNINVCVITQNKMELLRNYIQPNLREKKMRNYKFARRITAVLN